MAVRVFISHSTGNKPGCQPVASHARFREMLFDCLKKVKGVEVQVDVDIQPGAHWRDVLHGRLDQCDAAVVLVNEQALLHSPWVDFEIKILGWRAWIEQKDFRLIVVPFGGVTRRQIQAHAAWEPIALSEIQMVPARVDTLDISDTAAVKATIEEIVRAVCELPGRRSRHSVYEWIVDELTSFLKLETEVLEQIADELDVAGDRNPEHLKQKIAQRLYERGPKALKTLLMDYSSSIPNDTLQTALEILSTYWVNPSASATILKFCRNTATKQTFAINGNLEYFTPEAYIRKICCWRKTWPVFTVDGKRNIADVLEQIRDALKEEFRNNLRKSRTAEEDIDLRLNALLKLRLEEYEAPVFVALSPIAARDYNLIQAIYETYSNLRIILCTGTRPGDEPLVDIEMLKPEFDLEVEKDAWNDYDVTLSLLP